jgi:hypothetical protein
MAKNRRRRLWMAPNWPELSQISDSVSKKYLTARLTLNGFDTSTQSEKQVPIAATEC